MPKLSVWFVRASLIHMGVGFLFGSLILYHKGIPIYAWTWKLLNPHIELMIFGWTMQFVMGIAFWILPRFSGANRYGQVTLAWWSFALLNIGIVCTSVSEWFALDTVSLVGIHTIGCCLIRSRYLAPCEATRRLCRFTKFIDHITCLRRHLP